MIYGGYFDSDNKLARLHELESLMNDSNFWNDKKNSESVISEINSIKNILDTCSSLKNKIESNIELISMLDENDDPEIKEIINSDIADIESRLSDLECLLCG